MEHNKTELNERQANVLAALRQVPARNRLHGRAGGVIPHWLVDHYDHRTVQALVRKGFAGWHEAGLKLNVEEA